VTVGLDDAGGLCTRPVIGLGNSVGNCSGDGACEIDVIVAENGYSSIGEIADDGTGVCCTGVICAGRAADGGMGSPVRS
jgi:hypothetical protein